MGDVVLGTSEEKPLAQGSKLLLMGGGVHRTAADWSAGSEARLARLWASAAPTAESPPAPEGAGPPGQEAVTPVPETLEQEVTSSS